MNSRYFNTITKLADNLVKKSSVYANKILAEYNWLKDVISFPHPVVYDCNVNKSSNNNDSYYTMEYIDGKPLAELYSTGKLSVYEYRQIFKYIKDIVYKNLSNIQIDSIEQYRFIKETATNAEKLYEHKTRKRSKDDERFTSGIYKLNGKSVGTLEEILNNCKVEVSKLDIAEVHGDLCFSNIMVENAYFDKLKSDSSINIVDYIKFIDPRGMLGDDVITKYGDYKYDIAKLAHSAIGHYDLIKSGQIQAVRTGLTSYDLIYDFPSTNMHHYYSDIEEEFINIFSPDEVICKIMVHLFLSMVPLHSDNPSQQDAMIATALYIYQKHILKHV